MANRHTMEIQLRNVFNNSSVIIINYHICDKQFNDSTMVSHITKIIMQKCLCWLVFICILRLRSNSTSNVQRMITYTCSYEERQGCVEMYTLCVRSIFEHTCCRDKWPLPLSLLIILFQLSVIMIFKVGQLLLW